MADFVKKKIIEKLARFTRDIKPSDISLSFLRGKGELRNLDLNTEVISNALQLPPWISIDHVFCDTIKLDVPFTEISKSPIKCMLGLVTIHVSTSRDVTRREKADLLGNIGSSSSSYGLTEKIIDGMRIEIRAITVHFDNPVFKATIEISDVLIESTTPQWKTDILPNCRYKNEAEGSVIIYKKATWSSIKVEGTGVGGDDSKESHLSQLRLITSLTEIRVSLKRQLSNCKILFTRVSMILGDLVWVVTQGQLKALSRLAQSLTDSAVNFAQYERSRLRSSCESLDSVESFSSVQDEKRPDKPEKRSKSPRRKSDRDLHSVNRLLEYQIGIKNLPSHEVIQDSFHLKTGNVDIQLCDEKASLLLQVKELLVDIYLDQLAGSGRRHWNKSNSRLQENVDWSHDLIRQADKKQDINLSSVNIYRLRERGIVIRCSDFFIKSISDSDNHKLLPIISCDKDTFNLPNDIENPAFQCGITLYYYPLEVGNKFLVPRPNISIYLSPIHVNVHQEQCLWLAEFIHGVALTVNLNLLLSAHTEGQHLIQELKAKRDVVNKLTGIDVKFYLPYSKITLPVNEQYKDDRPRALQIETGGIHLENKTLFSLIENEDFIKAWNRIKSGWFTVNESQFPHHQNDPSVLPQNLVELIEVELKATKTPPTQRAVSSTALLHVNDRHGNSRKSAPDVTAATSHKRLSTNQLCLMTLESWHVYTRCVTVSFVADLSHQATMYTQQFVNDFPLHVWILQPKKFSEILELASPTDVSPLSSSSLPSVYALIDIADPISLELQHLQFLFLMRLKDSFQGFKNRIMKYFSIDSFLETQQGEAFQLNDECDGTSKVEDENAEDIKDKLKAAFTQGDRPRSNSKSHGDFATVGFTLSGVEVAVMLPTLTKVFKRKKSSSINLSSPLSQREIPFSNVTSPIITASVSDLTATESFPSPPVMSDNNSIDGFLVVGDTIEASQVTVNQAPESVLTEIIPSSNVDVLPSEIPIQLTPSESSSIQLTPSEASSIQLTPSETSSVQLTPSETSPHPTPPIQLKPPETPPIQLTSSETPPIQLPETPPVQLTPSEIPPHLIETQPSQVPHSPSSNSIPQSLVSSNELLKPHVSQVSDLKSSSVSSTSSVITPEYILYAETGIVRGIVIASSEGIGIKAAVDSVNIEELKEEEYKEKKDKKENKKRKDSKKSKCQKEDHCLPVIKARIELGKSVKMYFKDQTDTNGSHDGVIFLKLSGLKPQLGLKNTMIIKDFFDDELESDTPIPMQIRVMETQVTLKDYVTAPFEHPRNLTVNVPDLFVNRGPRAHNTNLLQAEGGSTPSKFTTNEVPLVEEQSEKQLSVSFDKFMEAIRNRTVGDEDRISSPDPQRLGELLRELQVLLAAPPTYLDTMSCDFYTNVTAEKPHPTVDSLQTELERLKKENLQLQKELDYSREEGKSTMKERSEVVTELVEIKMKYATLHLTHEKQLMQIDKLLTEKTDLQEQLKQLGSLGPLHV